MEASFNKPWPELFWACSVYTITSKGLLFIMGKKTFVPYSTANHSSSIPSLKNSPLALVCLCSPHYRWRWLFLLVHCNHNHWAAGFSAVRQVNMLPASDNSPTSEWRLPDTVFQLLNKLMLCGIMMMVGISNTILTARSSVTYWEIL